MKLALVASGSLIIGITIGLLLSPWTPSPMGMVLNTVIDTVLWGAEIQGHDRVVSAIEDFKADPEAMSRLTRFLEENPMPDCNCPCPERDEWERIYNEEMGDLEP